MSNGSYANLYFGPSTGPTIGFEITNGRAFTPDTISYVDTPLLTFAITNNSVEFSIPDTYFTGALAGLGPTGVAAGGQLYLFLSQSFGNSVAGGANYGSERLGTVTLAGATSRNRMAVPSSVAVPGPIAGAGLIPLTGLGVAWFARRRKQCAT